jgi:hypothetical protein
MKSFLEKGKDIEKSFKKTIVEAGIFLFCSIWPFFGSIYDFIVCI